MQAKDSIKVGNNFKWLLGICAVLVVMALLFLAFKPSNIPEGYLSPEDIQLMEMAMANALAEKDVEIEALQIIPETPEIIETIVEKTGYILDELFLGIPFVDAFSDRELNLFDDEVEFAEDMYDAEEVFNLDGLILLANENDFEDTPYMTVPEEGISYRLEFESSLDTSKIDNDDALVFNLLGEEVEISEWDVDKITFTQGTEHYLDEGQSVTVNEKVVLLDMVLENAIYVKVDGVGKKIVEGSTAKVNGIEVKVKEVLYSGYAEGYKKATLVVGEDVKVTISDGEEYEDDSIWEWVIDANSIGLVLVEEFMELDDDYNALAMEETICLPNDYICVRYDGVVEEDSETYTFELDTKSGLDYVEVRGNFLSGINDYDRIYINTFGIYDKDLELIDPTTIELEDTGLELELFSDSAGDWLKINDLYLLSNLTKVSYDGNDISSEEDNYLTDYGIVIDNPEDSCEDNEFKIIVPEEKLEATMALV